MKPHRPNTTVLRGRSIARLLAPLAVLALTSLLVAACGGSSSSSGASESGGSGGSALSATSLVKCAKKAHLPAKSENYDKSIGSTGQVSVTVPGDTLTVTLFGDESSASGYLDALGGEGPNRGAEPGGNEQVASAVIAYYKQGTTLDKVEACLGA